METIFSTDLVHPRDRFDYWHSLACKKITGHHSVPENRLTFEAKIQTAKFGNLDLVEFSNSPMQVSHTFAHVDRTSPEMVFLCFGEQESLLFDVPHSRSEGQFCPDLKVGRDIFTMRGIDRNTGCMVVVRPDQYVAHVIPLDGHKQLSACIA